MRRTEAVLRAVLQAAIRTDIAADVSVIVDLVRFEGQLPRLRVTIQRDITTDEGPGTTVIQYEMARDPDREDEHLIASLRQMVQSAVRMNMGADKITDSAGQ